MDAILYWNDVALEANRVSHTNGKNEQTGPPLSARALAIVHLAMYDAYAGVPGTPPLTPYLGLGPAKAGSSIEAAVAAAAHTTLTALFPSQKAFFDLRRALAPMAGSAVARTDGTAYGTTVAQAILADRAGDPDAGAEGYVGSTAHGHHRVDPDNPGQSIHAPFFGARCSAFAVTARWGLDAPPQPGTLEYRAALREVRGKGVAPQLAGMVPATMPRRTAEETIIGTFWGYDGAKELGTPPRLYNQIIRQLAALQGNTIDKNARLFALVNVAMADAGILAWEQKYVHDLWRPVLGIREHDKSMGPAGTPNNNVSNNCDPDWLPAGAPSSNTRKAATDPVVKNFTPPFPAYPSGHATFGAAAFHIARLFYGETGHGPDTLFGTEAVVSDELNGVTTDNLGTVRPRHTRDFPQGLWQMIMENSIGRLYLGVHWIFDGFVRDAGGGIDLTRNIGGVPLGIAIAEDIFNDGMHPSAV
ncbi:MAG: vanadium-dependent haloperoxidase [Acidimicrobiales bacterium]